MLFQLTSAATLLAIAAQASASEKMPYKPIVKMSVHEMFGLGARQASGYQPTQTICGTGATCATACGADFVQCASNDGQTHCFEPDTGSTCCSDGTGNSCDAGYFCTQDTTGQTWCCPDGQTLAQCAALYSITGSLVSETVAPTTTTSQPPATTSATTTTTTSYGGNVSITTDVETDYTTICPSASATLSYPGTNSTAAKITPTISTVPVAGAGMTAPSVASAVVIVAGVFAALLL